MLCNLNESLIPKLTEFISLRRIPAANRVLAAKLVAYSFADKNMMGNNPAARQQMFDMIEQWQQSGLTKKAYCDQQSIKHHTFYYWWRLRSKFTSISVAKFTTFKDLL